MTYASFSSDARTCSIGRPDTPTPWSNVISNGRYGLVVSNSGAGFAFLDNAQLNVISRWDMDLLNDARGRFIYLTDLDAKRTWSLTPAPCRTVHDEYRCDHTTGATTFNTRANDITAQWTLTVAPADNAELWLVTLTNNADTTRRIRATAAFEWCCGVAPDVKREFHKLFITTSHDPARNAILATKNMWDIPEKNPADHWNQPWPYAAACALFTDDGSPVHATADKAAFLGARAAHADPANPRWLLDETPSSRFGRFIDPMSVLATDLTLEPGQSASFHVVTAIAEAPAGATEHRDLTPAVLPVLDKFASPAAAAEAAAAATQAWNDRLAPTHVSTSDTAFDAMTNTWLPYQAISARLWARTGYYQQSGAFGFRDQLQDSQVWLPLDPKRTREQILLHAAHQFADGRVYHWWHPLAEFGLETLCSDDYLWLPFITATYARDTGDTGILDAVAPFIDDDTPTPLVEHCRRAINRALSRRSPRGLPLIGTCDWNDGLSAAGADGKGESVWLALFLIETLEQFATLLERAGNDAEAHSLRAKRDELRSAVNTHAWDGQWYRRATLDDGSWIGAAQNTEGRIYLNPQTWAILSGAAPDDRAAAAWKAVRDNLIQDMGPLLLAPAYATPDASIGYITRYSPGSRENGGVYTHAAVWALAAACHLKDTAAAERIYRAINPAIRSAADPDLWAAEPYATPGNIDGPLADNPGRAGWTWYTGSAAWLSRITLERIIGLRPTWDGLAIDPCPLPSLGIVEATRQWRGRTVRIRFDAADFSPGADPSITVNAEPRDTAIVSEHDAPAGATIEVEVAWTARESAPAPHSAPAPAERSL